MRASSRADARDRADVSPVLKELAVYAMLIALAYGGWVTVQHYNNIRAVEEAERNKPVETVPDNVEDLKYDK